MKQLTELKAAPVFEKNRFDSGMTILSCQTENGDRVTVKVVCDECDIRPHFGLVLLWYGRWESHPRYGRQFHAKNFVVTTPHTERGIVPYLMRAPHIGKARAQAAWKLYQGDAVRILREEPERFQQELGAKGFTLEKAKEAAEFLAGEKGLEDATLSVMSLLAGKGFPERLPSLVIKEFGAKAAERIHRDPYILMRFKGVGFLRADELYLSLGKDPARLKRQTLFAINAIETARDGDTWFEAKSLARKLAESVGSVQVNPKAAFRLGLRAGALAKYQNGTMHLTTAGRSEAERAVVERAVFMAKHVALWPDGQEIEHLDLSEHQKGEINKALVSQIGIFTGGPGTGKTYTAARIIGALIERYGQKGIAIAAPTGKAAVRISEALGEYNVPVKARTIHSLLGPKFDEGGFTFEHGPDNPIDARFVIVDEASMIDVELMASLLRALPECGHLLLIGDVGQLPPVGHGAPLRDLLAAGIPHGELTEIRRNSGLVVETCARIQAEEEIHLPRRLKLETTENLMLREANGPDEIAGAILQAVRRIRDGGKHSPVWETQVIVALNEHGDLSRKALNVALQAELNFQNRREGRFWEQDKVVCLSNSRFPLAGIDFDDDAAEDYLIPKESGGPEVYVANGELGRVVGLWPKYMHVEFQNPKRLVLVPGEPDKASTIDLAYAISCHKSQGSEWPIVIVALDDSGGAKQVCDRSWIYTSISRAKKACVLVGKESTLAAYCRKARIHDRRTFVVERIREELKR